ncbi:MAG: DNL zinc finger-domain-containing protein, partial [Piptocephalis tieghemiana]
RLLLAFTCKRCNHRSHKTFSKTAYETGVVIIQCDGCQSRHLIADNKGWFRDGRVTIEDLVREKGGQV